MDQDDRRGVHAWFKKFTSKDVVTKIFKDEIRELLEKSTDAPLRSKDWLKAYASSLSQFMKNMTPKQIKEVEEKVNEWNEQGPDEDNKQE